MFNIRVNRLSDESSILEIDYARANVTAADIGSNCISFRHSVTFIYQRYFFSYKFTTLKDAGNEKYQHIVMALFGGKD